MRWCTTRALRGQHGASAAPARRPHRRWSARAHAARARAALLHRRPPPHTHTLLPLPCSRDNAWAADTSQRAAHKESELIRIINNENINGIRENLRRAYADLAMHYSACGGHDVAISTWCVQ